jgi:hypothetical protein
MIKIPLNDGRATILDDCDRDLVVRPWHLHRSASNDLQYAAYSITENGVTQMVLLHRVIVERMLNRPLRSGEEVDHRDGDGLNNRRANLRACSHGENMFNQRKARTNTSGYKGVYWHRVGGKWAAAIQVNGRKRHLGLFYSKDVAARAYDRAARELFGEFARLNFPDGIDAPAGE